MATENLIGRTLGKYRIDEQIGRGGMAEVYKAYQPGLDRYVAIKVMHSFLSEDKDSSPASNAKPSCGLDAPSQYRAGA